MSSIRHISSHSKATFISVIGYKNDHTLHKFKDCFSLEWVILTHKTKDAWIHI